MKSRWTSKGESGAIERWGKLHGESFAQRLYTAKLIGEESKIVLHGGGNVSVKGIHRTRLGDQVDAIFVKGSGWDLATLAPDGLVELALAYLRRLGSLDSLTDEEMVNEFRTHLFDASAPTPSVETLVHAFLPHRFVDHSHADAVLTLTNQDQGRALISEALGERVAIIDYVRPGFDLACAVAKVYKDQPDIEGIVLLHHGLITFADDARTSYQRHIDLVDACERFIEQKTCGRSLTVRHSVKEQPTALAERVAPLLRGLVAVATQDADRPFVRSVLEWRGGQQVLAWVNSAEAKELAAAGPITGDHLIRTGPFAMFVDDPQWSDETALRKQLEESVASYRDDYKAYLTDHGGSPDEVDPSLRVVLLPGAGLFAWAKSKREACLTADIVEHTLAVKADAHLIGGYRALSAEHLYDMEFRSFQRAKLEPGHDGPLAGQVVAISGGAGAIGAAVALSCARAGAHVALADLDRERLASLVDHLEQSCGVGRTMGVVMDVTSAESVRAGFAEIVRTFGGVDVIVPNAGIAHVAPIDELKVDDFRRVMEVNAVGYLLFMQAGVRILKRQGLGGHVVINSSKNVFGPGKDFAAYSASKAAGHQLGKVAAIALAPYDIRVNMINPDAIFGDEKTPSGLWATVGPQRAKSRGMNQEDLIEYYRNRNLLKARIYGHHVGNAVVFFASNATPTTGATLPIDGGVVEAFPR